MATKTEFICDRCGKVQNDDKQFWMVGFIVTTNRYITSVSNYTSVQHKREWCRACVEEFGILPRVDTKDAPAPEIPLTIEDMIREIVREESAQQ